MKRYLELAKQYFQLVEGLQLYPSIRSFWFWAWIAASTYWAWALIQLLAQGQTHETSYASVLVPEALWVAVTLRIRSWKERQLVAATNRRLDTNYQSAAECRFHLLTDVMTTSPSQFLPAAKEIAELLSLKDKFRKLSDISASELAKTIYDRDSKPRLLTLTIALVSITVALIAKSDASLETLFDAFSDPGYRNFLLLSIILVSFTYLVLVGLRIPVLTMADVLVLWSIKLSRGSMFSTWLLAYLVRDLVLYHGTPMPVSIIQGHAAFGPISTSEESAQGGAAPKCRLEVIG